MTDRNLSELPDGERVADADSHYEPPSLNVIGSIEELTLLEAPLAVDEPTSPPT